jgi:hypothetical protein
VFTALRRGASLDFLIDNKLVHSVEFGGEMGAVGFAPRKGTIRIYAFGASQMWPWPSNQVSQANAPQKSGGEALGQRGFRAKETWKDAGAGTPEAALQTLLWAAREGAVARFDEMVFLPRRPDDGWYGSFTNDLSYVVGRVKQCSGVTIDGVKNEGAGVAVIQIGIDGIPAGRVAVSKKIRMIQVGTEWKCDYPNDSLVAFKIREGRPAHTTTQPSTNGLLQPKPTWENSSARDGRNPDE